jgi:predicted Zn-dependent protease
VSKRLAYLEKVTAGGSNDPMAWYGLAMEYRALGRIDEALQTFIALRQANPAYVPMFLMCGQMLEGAGRRDEAREWLEAGIEAAKSAKNAHALGELESALAALD